MRGQAARARPRRRGLPKDAGQGHAVSPIRPINHRGGRSLNGRDRCAWPRCAKTCVLEAARAKLTWRLHGRQLAMTSNAAASRSLVKGSRLSKGCRGGRIVSVAAIIAVAVSTDGRREVLGMEIGTSEAWPIWTEFPRKLTRHGLRKDHRGTGRHRHWPKGTACQIDYLSGGHFDWSWFRGLGNCSCHLDSAVDNRKVEREDARWCVRHDPPTAQPACLRLRSPLRARSSR